MMLFHILLNQERLVIYTITNLGERQVWTPRPDILVEKIWPKYHRYAPVLDAWFNIMLQNPEIASGLGQPDFPRTLAKALTHDKLLRCWAYASVTDIKVTFRQVARAAGMRCIPDIRTRLVSQGLAFEQRGGGHYYTTIGQVINILGSDVAGRMLLRPTQIAGFLGINRNNATSLIKRKGLAITESNGQHTVAPWSKVRRIRRIAPRIFMVDEQS